jgi:hypothetical protein
MEPWWPVDTTQLKETAPALSPDAPAEVLDWKIEVDDRARPSASTVHQYIRYKIFDPEKAAAITRVSQSNFSYEGSELLGTEMKARLIRPDGTIREFGKESVQERDLSRNGREKTWLTRLFGSSGIEVKEKFLATGGIEPGSVLEFQFMSTQRFPGTYFSLILQREGIPVRRVRLEQTLADPLMLTPLPVILNAAGLNVKLSGDVKKKAIVITAENLPGYSNEPFQAPIFNRALTYFGSYRWRNLRLLTNESFDARHIDGKEGPWAGFTAIAYIFEQDVTRTTKAIKRLSDEVTAGAQSDEERARRVHSYVQGRLLAFLKTPRTAMMRNDVAMPMSEDVANFEKNPGEFIRPMNFVYLAIALYRAAGLEAQMILLPRNDTVLFSPKMDSETFLPDSCVRVRVAGKWIFSKPSESPLVAFGYLPSENRGGEGLVVQDRKVEFIEIPESAASESVATNSGHLELGADGQLSGSCRRSLTGQLALNLRRLLKGKKTEDLHRELGDMLKEEFKADVVDVKSVEGFDDPEAPLTVDYSLHIADYAEVTKQRVIFRANVFHGLTPSPFSSDTRHNSIVFPYKWSERDELNLQLPQGYVFESPSSPPSQPGNVLNYTIAMSRSPKKNKLVVNRAFDCNAEEFPASSYATVKKWFDSMAQSDGHELILVRVPTPPPAPSGTPAPAQRSP